jgi:hypothetical protein
MKTGRLRTNRIDPCLYLSYTAGGSQWQEVRERNSVVPEGPRAGAARPAAFLATVLTQLLNAREELQEVKQRTQEHTKEILRLFEIMQSGNPRDDRRPGSHVPGGSAHAVHSRRTKKG